MAAETSKPETIINPLKGRRNSFVEVAMAAKKIEQAKVKPVARFSLRRSSKDTNNTKNKSDDSSEYFEICLVYIPLKLRI